MQAGKEPGWTDFGRTILHDAIYRLDIWPGKNYNKSIQNIFVVRKIKNTKGDHTNG